jgi:hypothetical protein
VQCAEMHLVIPMERAITAAQLWYGFKIPEPFGDFASWPLPSAEDIRLWEHATKRHENLCSDVYLIIRGLPGVVQKIKYCCRFILPPVGLLYEYRTSASPADIPLAYIRRWFSILRYR